MPPGAEMNISPLRTSGSHFQNGTIVELMQPLEGKAIDVAAIDPVQGAVTGSCIGTRIRQPVRIRLRFRGDFSERHGLVLNDRRYRFTAGLRARRGIERADERDDLPALILAQIGRGRHGRARDAVADRAVHGRIAVAMLELAPDQRRCDLAAGAVGP